VAVARGDQFIVRVPSPSYTVGGGVVVDPHPKRHKRFHDEIGEALTTLEQGTPEEIILQHMPQASPIDFQGLVRRSGLPVDQAMEAVRGLLTREDALVLDGGRGASGEPSVNSQSLLISAEAWSALKDRTISMLEGFHAEHPLRRGMPREEARSRLGLDARAFARVESRLLSEGLVAQQGPLMCLAGHEVRFTDDQRRRVELFTAALKEGGASPESATDLSARFGLNGEVLAALLDQGAIVEVAPGLFLERQVYEETVATIVEMIKSQGSATVATVRDRFNTSRKYALALMEHLDEKRITRRTGDERVLY
jgi:selenocysteine-specific elongation factor